MQKVPLRLFIVNPKHLLEGSVSKHVHDSELQLLVRHSEFGIALAACPCKQAR